MMPDQRLRLTRALFLRLINVDIVELNVTRRRVPVSELIVSKQEETDLLAVVRAAFIHARLLTASAMGETPTLEISHEALIDGWPLLQEWLQGARKTMLLQQTISRDVTEWFRYGRPADRLYQGEQLKEALAWRKENLSSLDEDVFLQACIDTHQQTHMRMIRRNVVLSLISLVGGISISSAVILLKTANTGSFTGASTPTPTPSPIPSVGQTLLVHSGHSLPINSIAWSPDGKYIASASDDATVMIWDATTAGDAITIYTGHTGLVLAVAWSPDGTSIASASYDKTVQVWNAITGSNPDYIPLFYVGHTGPVNGVTWSPDGKHIASASDDKTVQIWDATTGQKVLTYNHRNRSCASCRLGTR
jgi:WD domain, G-beta repeat